MSTSVVPESPTSPGLGLADIKELLQVFDVTDVGELTVEHGDFRLCLKKYGTAAALPTMVMAAPAAVASATTAPAASVAVAPVAPVAVQAESKLITLNAPMVGTYYASPSPEAPPFVSVGDHVKVGQTVCIVEAMKLMNEIEAEFGGRVVRVLATNGQSVEYGQPLIEIEPA